MRTIGMIRGVAHSSTLLILSLLWLAAPHASQNEGANEGFLLFTSDRHRPVPEGCMTDCDKSEDIYVMSPELNSDAVRLTYGGGDAHTPGLYSSFAADWSHTRKLIAFTSNRNGVPEIFTMAADGSDQQLLVSLGSAGANFPSFSPSGNELCFQRQALDVSVAALRRRDIYIANVDGGEPMNLTSPVGLPGQAGNNIRCDWSPQHHEIAFGSTRDGNEEIYVMNADGTGVRRLTAEPGADANPAWSPTGHRIAFESNRDGNPEIYLMNGDGSGLKRLTSFAGQDTKPSWSPNGNHIAFHRRIAGHLELFTMDVDADGMSEPTQITFTLPVPGFSGFPTWGKRSARP
jgi:TolB protein